MAEEDASKAREVAADARTRARKQGSADFWESVTSAGRLLQVVVVVATVATPVAVAVALYSAAGNLNTAVALLQLADPLTVAFKMVVAYAPLFAVLPLMAVFWSTVQPVDSHRIRWLLIVGFGGATAWFFTWLIDQTRGFAIASAVMALLGYRQAIAFGYWKKYVRDSVLWFAPIPFFLLSGLPIYPLALVSFDGGEPTEIRIIQTSSDGTYYLDPSIDSDNESRLKWTPEQPTAVEYCGGTGKECPTPAPAPTPEPSPSGGSPSSTPEPSAD